MDNQAASKFPLLSKTIDFIVLFFILALVNINSLIRFRQFPEVDNYSDHEGTYILVAALSVVTMGLLLSRRHLLGEYCARWRSNRLLMAFLLYSLVTILWSVYVHATAYKLIFLFFSTIAGAYLAVRYKTQGVIEILTWFAAFCAALSILIVAFLPYVGMMYKEYFLGSWTGMFWHRNHTGNLFAFFNMIFLLRLFLDDQLTSRRRFLMGLLYLLAALIVFGSRSATGIIVFLFLNFVAGLTIFWLHYHRRLQPWHYYTAVITLAAGFLVFVANTAFFFGLLGRSASMTGRVPVWQDLFQNFYLHKPWLGYGYGALWMQKSFRILMQIRHQWTNQVYFADNGFFDILLNLGLIGFALFLAIYVPLGVRSFKQAITHKTWLHFVPFLTFLYIFIGNLTYSFLLEVDQMVWLLLVTMVFLTTPASRARIPQP
jgi:exopolysaccharide production protein ExoQ